MSKIVFDNKNRKRKANFKTQKYGGQISLKPYLALLSIFMFVVIIYQLELQKVHHGCHANNQRTNGPVNAHLISGPSISTKHTIPR